MPLLRFTKKLKKLRDHRKKQTIRKPRKNPLKVGDNLIIYELRKVGEAPLTKLTTKPLKDITLEEAQKDGFETIEECISLICEMHKCTPDEVFDVIEYDPQWPKHKIVRIRE